MASVAGSAVPFLLADDPFLRLQGALPLLYAATMPVAYMSATPASTAPNRRSDSRRGMASANDLILMFLGLEILSRAHLAVGLGVSVQNRSRELAQNVPISVP